MHTEYDAFDDTRGMTWESTSGVGSTSVSATGPEIRVEIADVDGSTGDTASKTFVFMDPPAAMCFARHIIAAAGEALASRG